MGSRTFPIGGDTALNSLIVDRRSLTAFYATAQGQVRQFSFLRESDEILAEGFQDIRALAEAPDGFGLYIAEANGDVRLALRRGADIGETSLITSVAERVVAAALHTASRRLLIVTEAGALLAMEPSDGTTTQLYAGFSSPRALAVSAATAHAWVLEAVGDDGSDRQLRGFDLNLQSVVAPIALPIRSDVLCSFAADGGEELLVVDPADGTTVAFDPATAASTAGAVSDPGATGIAHWRSLILTVGAAGLLTRDWQLADAGADLGLPLAPAYGGGYLRGSIDLANLGVDRADLEVAVEEVAGGWLHCSWH